MNPAAFARALVEAAPHLCAEEALEGRAVDLDAAAAVVGPENALTTLSARRMRFLAITYRCLPLAYGLPMGAVVCRRRGGEAVCGICVGDLLP